MNKTQIVTNKAIRQFRHNDDNSPDVFSLNRGFVIAYDTEVMDKHLASQDKRIEKLQFELSSYMESDANLRKKVEELEAENRVFRNTESVDDSVWDALLEQVYKFQAKLQRIGELKRYEANGGGEWEDDRGSCVFYRDIEEIIAELEKE